MRGGNANAAVAGDDISRSSGGAANGVVWRAEEANAAGVTAQRRIARGVDADEVALNRVAARVTVMETEVETSVGEHDVTSRGCGAANQVVLCENLDTRSA